MSSGCPGRFIGEAAATASTSIGEARVIGVSMKPGGILFTVMRAVGKLPRECLGQRDDAALG